MPSIEIDNDVWAYLQSKAVPFQDAPNDVLRREFGLEARYESAADPSQNLPIRGPVVGLTQTDATQVIRPSPTRIANNHGHFENFRPDRDYTYFPVRGYQLEGNHVAARSFKDVLISVTNHLRGMHGHEFDRIASALRGRKRVYFSQNQRELKYPHSLAGNGLFMETNLNANLIVGICRSLLEKLGHDPSSFQIE